MKSTIKTQIQLLNYRLAVRSNIQHLCRKLCAKNNNAFKPELTTNFKLQPIWDSISSN